MLRAAVAENRGDIDQMRADVDTALRDFRRLGDRWGLSAALSSLGYMLTLDGELELASDAYAEAAALMDELGANADGGFMRLRLAGLRLRQGRFDEARRHVDRVLQTPGMQGEAMAAFGKALQADIALLEEGSGTMRQLRDRVAADLDLSESRHPVSGRGEGDRAGDDRASVRR